MRVKWFFCWVISKCYIILIPSLGNIGSFNGVLEGFVFFIKVKMKVTLKYVYQFCEV